MVLSRVPGCLGGDALSNRPIPCVSPEGPQSFSCTSETTFAIFGGHSFSMVRDGLAAWIAWGELPCIRSHDAIFDLHDGGCSSVALGYSRVDGSALCRSPPAIPSARSLRQAGRSRSRF